MPRPAPGRPPPLSGGRCGRGSREVSAQKAEELPAASPPSCLPRPLPSSFKPRLARVVSVQSRPPPSEEMAEEPQPQVLEIPCLQVAGIDFLLN
ncbi:translation initiation factor IF-2-like [Vulpes lagopus]|uniref:translation initiation factor IF-2-like n=1 Tax=Vulpes lagopus TaxID=494514 RepID=UPI001BC8EC5B|nr:translation initiation factor IF-2-like [Vulpes lagopus]